MTEFVSRWFTLDQTRIDAFAANTEDRAGIHVDTAAETPFDGTIAHGFLTLSLLSAMSYDAVPQEPGLGLNYGFDRIRFVSPVPSGSNVRGRFSEKSVDRTPSYVAREWSVVVEIEGADRPALVATWLTRHIKEPA